MQAQETAARRPRTWGIYAHIPFCRQKCGYCDFTSWAGCEKDMAAYVQALRQEIRRRGAPLAARWGRPATLYIGGGTPTALPPALLAEVVAALLAVGAEDGAPPAEITVEANPGTVDAACLEMLRKAGVNRLSFGVQSFSDRLLRRIGRIHTAAQAREAVQLAQQVGFTNISLDLMYGLPGQTLEDLRASVAQAVALGPAHISIYGLQVEDGTAFARQRAAGALELPAEDACEEMYDYMTQELPRQGYARYEISNFARPGFESRHNLSYWQDVPYLGVGVAAHSYLDGQRYANAASLASYLERIRQGEAVYAEEEPATREIQMEEFCFLALRTARGIDKQRFRERFGVTLSSVYAAAIRRMKAKGLLAEDAQTVHLTENGMKYGNWVFEAFLL